MSLAGPSFTESVIVRSADAEVVGRAPTPSACWPMPAPPAVPCPPSASRSAAAPTAPGRPSHRLRRAVLPARRHRPAPVGRPGNHRRTRRPRPRPAGPRPRLRRRSGPRRRHPHRHHPGCGALRVLPPPRTHRVRQAAHRTLLEVQELYDTYFQSSAPWNQARALSAPLPDSADLRESSRGRSE